MSDSDSSAFSLVQQPGEAREDLRLVFGFGGELKVGRPGSLAVALQGHWAFCNYDGSTKYFVSSQHREKHLDLDHVNYRARGLLEVPMSDGRNFFVGIQYQLVDSEAVITTQSGTAEEIIARHEKWDKEASFDLSSFVGLIGLTF